MNEAMTANAPRPPSSADVLLERVDVQLNRLENIMVDAEQLHQRVAGDVPVSPVLHEVAEEVTNAGPLANGGYISYLEHLANKLEHVTDQLAEHVGRLNNHL